MALENQVHIFNLDTSAFYDMEEQRIHNLLCKNYVWRKKLKRLEKREGISKKKLELCRKSTNARIKRLDVRLRGLLKDNNERRELNPDKLIPTNVISVFESNLTRTLGIKTGELSMDLMVVKTYFFDVFRDLMLDGYICNGEKYVFFMASAGQIRTKKSVFIKESSFIKHAPTLMCGLTVEDINSMGGVNKNKYLAYLALCNSATDVWGEFDIDKCIVVEDFETLVEGEVDYICHKTYEITRKRMGVPVEHTDGCGMVLPQKFDKNVMIRLPWVKGLLSPFPYDKFISEKEGTPVVADIYGKEWNVIEDGIEVILVKSQFKMHNYYKNVYNEDGSVKKYGWDVYKENFKKYNCTAGICNIEEDVFDNSKLGYQMLQTLTDIDEYEMKKLCERTVWNIRSIGYDRRTMLKVLGVTKGNNRKNYLQQAIEIYPELLNDAYCKNVLRQVKRSLVKNARAGKIDINGKYTFIVPDLYAFCERLFLGIESPKGLLADGEVSCLLYKGSDELDCLRSPHLYKEHAVRKNVVNPEVSKWFVSNGLYTSVNDLISKLLQFDVDGDKALVVADRNFINIAKRNMEGIVPLYYEMGQAKIELITNQSLYEGMTTAYSSGNIGKISNDITKEFDNEEPNLDVVKYLCMENNFTIDYAKTLYKPTRPKHIDELISGRIRRKVPHFFRYAKNREVRRVEPHNDNTVNKLKTVIPNPNINFKKVGLDNFNFRKLMYRNNISIETDSAKKIIEKYNEVDLKRIFMPVVVDEFESGYIIPFAYIDIRNQLLEVENDVVYVTDVLLKYLYTENPNRVNTTLWTSFGDVIVQNLKHNIQMDQIYCVECGNLVDFTTNIKKYCSLCAKNINRKKTRERMKNIRKGKNV